MPTSEKPVGLARKAQQRLALLTGLHMTPATWLHITTLVAGPADNLTGHDLEEMAAAASHNLATTQPVTIRLGEIWYHPEAIMLGVQPTSALEPLHNAAKTATRKITGTDGLADGPGGWRPHITICYSTAQQPAAPIIGALGRHLPGCEARINTLSLVIQRGPERTWDWHPVESIHLGELNPGIRNDKRGQWQ